MSDVIGAECFFGYTLSWYNLHTDVAFAHDGVGQKRQEFVSGIVISVVSQQVYQALALLIQHGHVEVVAAAYQTFIEVGADQTVGTWPEAFVDESIDIVGLTHVDIVAQFYGTGIARAVYTVGYLAVKITVVVQQVGCYLDTSFRIDGRNVYGVGGQFFEYPMAKSFFISLEAVVYP
ncbi:unknown [Bacteroides sp. CAG:443]|nr:unknown [Bacteroides sp. CAG:443]